MRFANELSTNHLRGYNQNHKVYEWQNLDTFLSTSIGTYFIGHRTYSRVSACIDYWIDCLCVCSPLYRHVLQKGCIISLYYFKVDALPFSIF